jgi:hypothetical protein
VKSFARLLVRGREKWCMRHPRDVSRNRPLPPDDTA